LFGTINKIRLTDKLLKDNPSIIEVYSDHDFSFENDTTSFYFLCNSDLKDRGKHHLNFVKLLQEVQHIFDRNSKIYFARSSFDIMLESKKLIWRKGKWFV